MTCAWCGLPILKPQNKTYCQRRCATMDYVAKYAYEHEAEMVERAFAERRAAGTLYAAKWKKDGERR